MVAADVEGEIIYLAFMQVSNASALEDLVAVMKDLLLNSERLYQDTSGNKGLLLEFSWDAVAENVARAWEIRNRTTCVI